MLAVFEKTVASSPETLALLNRPSAESVCAFKDEFLVSQFRSVHPSSVTVNLGSGLFAYSLAEQNPLLPRLFVAVDGIFCLFQGHIENVAFLKQQYGLGKTTNEAVIVTEAYRTLRDRGPYPAEKVVRDFQGKFAYVIFDASKKTLFVATDAEGSVPFFWGTDGKGNLVFSAEPEMAKASCAKSHAPFPKGCLFTSAGGLRSFEHPMKELKAVPRVDSSGELCGATFKVDPEATKDKGGMPRIGSSHNWSEHI